MKIKQFDFNLPKELIAQHPSYKRDHSKLLVANYQDKSYAHKNFFEIIDYLSENDVLVVNETKVLPARLIGIKAETDAVVEVLLLKSTEKDIWHSLTKPAKRVKIGTIVQFGDQLKMICTKVLDEGIRVFKLVYEGVFLEVLQKLGTMPLPPYITEKLANPERYQTVYAKELGSAAAPTAGLHFTPTLLKKIKAKGVHVIPIVLHIGLGTFKPVSEDNVLLHKMHEEVYTITPKSANLLNQAVKDQKRIICVGTTSLRALESNYKEQFYPGTFSTDIFIYPGYQFKVVKNLITNFHLPKSTLVMLVSALTSVDFIQKAYHEAIINKYRFFSFGDSMFISS
ncbi:MAG: tRNA preQ1(34) S-adenosylmethionine ribosyltransferase-isomerase QueA [Acholeplasmataceae bacterium]